jgi:hypothetical protein
MILFIEGPRHSGKTYLIEKFLEQNTDPTVEYYKFYFANHLKTLDLEWQEDQPGLHYFSLGNIMTIMEMNLRPEYKDKVWLFDRAIVSAYTWAILRKRLSKERARREFQLLIESDLYRNCRTLFVLPEGQTGDLDRQKDHWDGIVKTKDEADLMADFIQDGIYTIANTDRNNTLHFAKNTFDQASVNQFIQSCNLALGLNK